MLIYGASVGAPSLSLTGFKRVTKEPRILIKDEFLFLFDPTKGMKIIISSRVRLFVVSFKIHLQQGCFLTNFNSVFQSDSHLNLVRIFHSNYLRSRFEVSFKVLAFFLYLQNIDVAQYEFETSIMTTSSPLFSENVFSG